MDVFDYLSVTCLEALPRLTLLNLLKPKEVFGVYITYVELALRKSDFPWVRLT